MIDDQDKKEYVAKFSSTTDSYPVVKAEYIGMRLAAIIGLHVPHVKLRTVLQKDILLIERFDRAAHGKHQTRKFMLSGLSLLGLNELEARYASYCDLADIIRKHFTAPKLALHELYRRLIFNILIGNNDDHARNHSAFWTGTTLSLTPAYDLCPQARTGFETTQAMAIEGTEGNFSTLNNVLSICERFHLSSDDARKMMLNMLKKIEYHWENLCQEAKLSTIDRKRLWGTSILNPFCLQHFVDFS